MDFLEKALSTLYSWQSLVTGFLAIFAAWIAARPVWRQLKGMETQSNAMLRDILAPRIGELEANREAALGPTREAIDQLRRDIDQTDKGEMADFNEHAAFAHWQNFRDVQGKYEKFRARHMDVASIEVWKDDLAVALAHLTDRLDDIHTPASRDQSGEDYAFTDEEWDVIKKRAIAARLQVPKAIRECMTASDSLSLAYNDQIDTLRVRIVEVDRALLR